jgi:hypothetical protein
MHKVHYQIAAWLAKPSTSRQTRMIAPRDWDHSGQSWQQPVLKRWYECSQYREMYIVRAQKNAQTAHSLTQRMARCAPVTTGDNTGTCTSMARKESIIDNTKESTKAHSLLAQGAAYAHQLQLGYGAVASSKLKRCDEADAALDITQWPELA